MPNHTPEPHHLTEAEWSEIKARVAKLEENQAIARCGATLGQYRCTLPDGHNNNWHDDGKHCWPVEDAKRAAQPKPVQERTGLCNCPPKVCPICGGQCPGYYTGNAYAQPKPAFDEAAVVRAFKAGWEEFGFQRERGEVDRRAFAGAFHAVIASLTGTIPEQVKP